MKREKQERKLTHIQVPVEVRDAINLFAEERKMRIMDANELVCTSGLSQHKKRHLIEQARKSLQE